MNEEKVETKRNEMKPYFTQIREQQDGTFWVVGGENPDALAKVGGEKTYEEAQKYRSWWVTSMGVKANHVNHGFQPLVPLQGHIHGH